MLEHEISSKYVVGLPVGIIRWHPQHIDGGFGWLGVKVAVIIGI